MTAVSIKRLFFTLLFLIFVSGQVSAEIVHDSLLNQLQHSQDSIRAEILNTIAESLFDQHPKEALKYAEDALAYSIKFKNIKTQINALLNIGDSYYYQNNNTLALEYYSKALQISLSEGNIEMIGLSYYYLGLFYDELNDFEKAKENYLESISRYELLNYPKDVSEIDYYLGGLLKRQGENYNALKYYEKSLAIYDSLSIHEESAQVLNSIGILYYDWGNYEKTIVCYKQSLKIMKEIQNKSGISQILNNLGIVYYDQQNFEEALRYFEESLNLEKELNNSMGIATSFNNIGIIYADRKNDKKALAYYEKSLTIYEELNDKSGIATALNNIGELYSNSEQHDLAIVMLERSLQLEKENADKFGIALAYVTLSELYLKSGNLETSRLYNDSSYNLALEIENPETLLVAYKNYTQIFKAQGNIEKAFDFQALHTALKDSIFNQQLHNQLSEIQAKYELEKKENEIELLNSQNKLHELDLENKKVIVARQRIISALAISGFTIILVILLILYRQIKQKKHAFKTLRAQNREILHSREELLIAKEKAEESDRLKSLFLANMSHELRTPLNGILGFTDVLRTEIDDLEHRDMAEIIHASGNRLHDTLNSIIDLSIIEANKMEMEFSNIPLYEFIEERITLFGATASKKNLSLHSEVPDRQVLIYSDRKILTNLLNNLIDNAIKYTREGGITLTATIIHKRESAWLKLQVKDTGIGIELDKSKNIFDKFRQGSEGHNRQFEGAGLGLTISKKYTEILNGEISLESQTNQGSTFTILIPVKTKNLAQIAEHTPSPPRRPARIKKQFSGSIPDILIVENDETNTAHMVHIFKNFCNTETASNSTEAIEKASLQQFHAILMDINLGAGPNGMETAQAIKKIKGYQNTPIIAITANAMKGHKEEFLANGCTHYISKPFTADAIKQLIMEVVEESL